MCGGCLRTVFNLLIGELLIVTTGVLMMASSKRPNWEDNSDGTSRAVRPDTPPEMPIRPLNPTEPRRLPGDRLTPIARIPRTMVGEQARRAHISTIDTTRLTLRPVPSITPSCYETVNGKRDYTLQLRQDAEHGKFRVVHALLGPDGSGVVKREDAAWNPTARELHGIEYKNTTSEMPFAWDELVQLAVAACHAKGVTWPDTCRLIEQGLRQLQEQTPPERPEGA